MRRPAIRTSDKAYGAMRSRETVDSDITYSYVTIFEVRDAAIVPSSFADDITNTDVGTTMPDDGVGPDTKAIVRVVRKV